LRERREAGTTKKEKGAAMSNDPKAVATQYYEIFGNYSPDALEEICASDLKGHMGAGATLDQLKDSISGFLESFPDLRADVKHLVREGDVVSAWVTYSGTHQGTFAGVPGTGRSLSFPGWDLFRVEDGRIAELTSYCDVFSILNQIGALPTATPA
jgi:steroid delta-isomerase-like uncharacterized protein